VKTPPFIEEKTGPPIIDLGDIRLRPLRPGDERAMADYISDPRVIEHTSIPLLGLEAVTANIKRDIAAYDTGTSCRWAIADSTDRLIGICGFNNWSFVHEHAELAYELDPRHWGRGFMRRSVRAALGWAFDTGFTRVHAFVMTSNSRSIAVLERCGFSREGTLRQFRIARGTPRDFHVYSLLREEWTAPRSGASSPSLQRPLPG
jgi:ribosomal-protein-alanine N-acetyltransferase